MQIIGYKFKTLIQLWLTKRSLFSVCFFYNAQLHYVISCLVHMVSSVLQTTAHYHSQWLPTKSPTKSKMLSWCHDKNLVVRKTRSKNKHKHLNVCAHQLLFLMCHCSCHINLYNTELKCGSDFPLLHFGLCMIYDNATGATEYGPCPCIHCKLQY